MNTRYLLIALTSSLLAATALISCGGGDGGSGDGEETDFEGAASVTIDGSPRDLDSGDRITIRAEVGEVNKNGILLKFRYPQGLQYVRASAFLNIFGETHDLTPAVDIAEPTPASTATAVPSPAATSTGSTSTATGTSNVFLVFFLTQGQFTHPDDEVYKGDFGQITLQLEAIDEVGDGVVEVDADIDDPAQPNSIEFDPENPEFSAQDQISVQVRD